MSRLHGHVEIHATDRIGWLRAAVMGANDGIVSTASLIVGVAAASAKPSASERPIPRLAPVTIAAFPPKLKRSIGYLSASLVITRVPATNSSRAAPPSP